jgi:hypothetical protein
MMWQDMTLEPPPSGGEYGVHVVMVVDSSGSMRKNDVKGYASRKAAVYDCLVRDLVQPQLCQGYLEAGGNAVASLIEYYDVATAHIERAPFNATLVAKLRQLGNRRAQLHGNCACAQSFYLLSPPFLR